MLRLLFLTVSVVSVSAFNCTQPNASTGYNAPTEDPTMMDDSTDTAWPVTAGTASFASACATGYSGTVVAAACTSDGPYTLSGCAKCRTNAATCISLVIDSTCDNGFYLNTSASGGATCEATVTAPDHENVTVPVSNINVTAPDQVADEDNALDHENVTVPVSNINVTAPDQVADEDNTIEHENATAPDQVGAANVTAPVSPAIEDGNTELVIIIIGCGVVFGVLVFIFYPRKREKNVKKSDEVSEPLLNGELNFKIDF